MVIKPVISFKQTREQLIKTQTPQCQQQVTTESTGSYSAGKLVGQSVSLPLSQPSITSKPNRVPDIEEQTAESSMEEQVINANTVFPCSWPKCYWFGFGGARKG